MNGLKIKNILIYNVNEGRSYIVKDKDVLCALKVVPSRITPLARALTPRQPYSEAVKSDGEERFPLFP